METLWEKKNGSVGRHLEIIILRNLHLTKQKLAYWWKSLSVVFKLSYKRIFESLFIYSV